MKRKTHKHKGRTIARLPSGRYQIRIKDSAGKPYRPSFPDLKEAKAVVDQFLAKEARGERFLASAAHTTFSEALDLRGKQIMDDGLSRSALHAFESIRRAHLEKEFGHRKLTEFVDERMMFVKEWFEKKKEEGYASSAMDRWRTEIKLAFQAAISEGRMAPPNPITAFGLSIPYVERERRQPLPIDDMTAWMRGSSERMKGQHHLASVIRRVSILGLSAPFRTQDLCGLCWDCVHLEGRLFFFRRVVKQVHGDKRWRLEDTTKTGDEGFGECHMSPPAHAVLCWWRDFVHELRLPTEGRIPVFRTPNASLLAPGHLQQCYVPTICENAGLLKADGSLKYTWYNLRHTVPSMWRAIGMDLDEIKDRMRHLDLKTTEIYRHRVPEYAQILRPQVEDVIDDLDLQRTPEGLIDALGIVLARMWRGAGIEVPCSPPTTMRRKRGRLDGEQPPAIEGPVSDGPLIEMTPSSVTTNASPPPPMDQVLMSPQQLRDMRITEAKRLRAPPYNWTIKEIEKHLGVSYVTISTYLVGPDHVRSRRNIRAERRALKQQVAIMRDAGRNPIEIANELKISRALVTQYERERGKPMKRTRRSWKIGPHEARIRQLIAEGKGDTGIARELSLKPVSVNQFIRRLGLRDSTDSAQGIQDDAAGSPKARRQIGVGD